MDWSTPGRIDDFEFIKINPNALGTSPGTIDGVVGGKLTFDYDSELKVSGSLDVVNTNFTNGCLIRIKYVVKKNNSAKAEKFTLCTCYADTTEMNYENGQWNGTINLRSVLSRYIDDQISNNWVFQSGSSAIKHFKNTFSWLGGAYTIKSNVKDKKYPYTSKGKKKNVVHQMGTSPMEVLNSIAKFLSCEITCDNYGQTVLQKKIAPKYKAVSKPIPSGDISVTLPGLTKEDTVAGTVNRVVVRYSYKKSGKTETLRGVASVVKTHRASYKNQGRYVTKTYTLNTMSPQTQKRIDQIAKNYLLKDSAITRYWKFTCFYVPITDICLKGGVVQFDYGNLKIDAQVVSVDMDLAPGGKLEVTLKEVRRRGGSL